MQEKKKIDILGKISFTLFGVFLTSMIFSTSVKLLNTAGIWVGFLICGGLVFCGFYYINKGSSLRIVTWGILSTLVIGIIGFTILYFTISDILKGF